MDNIDWDRYFMSLSYLTGMKSKDQSTTLGAVVVGSDNEVRTIGYNSFPRGLNDSLSERQERPEKYKFIEHAERNAIYNAAKMGTSLNGCKIYVSLMPCADCARAIIQSGIKTVIVHKEHPGNDNAAHWSDSFNASKIMFDECGVEMVEWSGQILEIKSLFGGDEFTPK